ncbi:unnamed protein product [Paramecium octaurelia]|uniref:Transmembrane protein n=1 Tax=Paramecium octaurelia TaxID=43137 RepID=A0A8S1U576_PAROT|nr:unnamed protein product [Paramecium octaurelia]
MCFQTSQMLIYQRGQVMEELQLRIINCKFIIINTFIIPISQRVSNIKELCYRKQMLIVVSHDYIVIQIEFQQRIEKLQNWQDLLFILGMSQKTGHQTINQIINTCEVMLPEFDAIDDKIFQQWNEYIFFIHILKLLKIIIYRVILIAISILIINYFNVNLLLS